MKNKKLLKLSALILVIFMLLPFVASCGCNPAESTDTETETETGKPNEDPKTVRLLNIDYSHMTYVGTSLKDFSKMFDEQTSCGDPRDGSASTPSTTVPVYDADNDGDIDDEDRAVVFEVTVDLGCIHRIECIYIYSKSAGTEFTVEAGTPFKYEFAKSVSAEKSEGWTKIPVDGDYRYINLKFKNGSAPSEVLFYGYENGEYDEVSTKEHESKPFSYLLGINGNQNDSATQLGCASYFRDYFSWAWAYDRTVYPLPGTNFSRDMATKYDSFYKILNAKGISPVPCFMYSTEAVSPAFDGSDKYLPSSYAMYGEFVHQVALRYGNNASKTEDDVRLLVGKKVINKNYINWIEIGNEPNGEGNNGFTPYQLAALTSCAYDGHNSTITVPDGSGVGIKNADPNIKVAMSGLAGINRRYIQSMVFWLKNNRSDGSVGIDAFNVHTYCRKSISYNGYTVTVGMCPELGNIVSNELKELIEYRNKYYPGIEVWVTEFGWDTNQSYETENSAHAYGPYTGRQVQAMWLVRAYFMFAQAGVDRAAMYMCKDTGDEETTVGKYGTSGVIASNGKYKDSYYYLYTLKSTMSDMRFAEVIDSGNEDVWIYRFENGDGKSCYAVWCPTMDNVRYDNFKVSVNGTTATLTEFASGETSGISSSLTVTDGAVTVNVSECPILIFSE